MSSNFFQIQDGLSQRTREFPELVKSFFSMDSMSEKSILELMKKYARENGSPHFFDNVNLSKVVAMMNNEADGETDPAVALYAVCAKLMGRVRENINEFPDRRIDFYYHKILKEQKRDPEGDHAFVTFDVDNEKVSCWLFRGTRFSAGENSDGESVEFESVDNVHINDVKVEKIFTVSCASGYPVMQSEIPVYVPKELSERMLKPYPLFGLTRSNEVLEGSTFSNVGLCVSNRIFYMSSGVRNVKLNLLFVPSSLQNTVIEYKQGNASAFSAAFTNAFKLSLTTENGWLDIEDYKMGCKNLDSECPENQITIEFTLKDTDPAIVNYNSEIHGGEYRTSHPVLRLLLNPRKSRSLWHAFKNVKLQRVCVSVDVSKCRDIAVSNEYGPASTLLPVLPFGAIPQVGSSFIVGCKEICGKKMNAFNIHGKWCGLPNSKDFSEWYSQYENPPHNSDFVVSLSGLYGGTWLPSDNNEITCKLFNSVHENSNDSTVEGYGYIESKKISTDFKISFNNIVRSRTSEIIPNDDNFMYSPMMKDGFFKMKLIAPSKAFMHNEFSKTVCNSFLTQVLKKKSADVMPNQPYTPSLEDLYVDYSSFADILFSSNESHESDSIFFLHPFGYSKKESFAVKNGALYLGLSYNGKPKKVNLYFMLNRDSAMRFNGNAQFFWSYLGPLGWTSLPAKNRLADSTADFTSSGIVTVDLPSDMVKESHLMPGGYYWIRIMPCDDSWRECSRLLTVFAQTVEVKRVSGFENGRFLKRCRAHTIKELTKSIAGLSNVYQFEESFGGKIRESESKMRIRVAETLYHRNRCVCPADYERIILERFSDVYKVKCFPHVKIDETTGSCDFASPGNLLVVPIPSMFNDGSFQWDPCLKGSVLRSIREFLQSHISGIANVQVINPFFDKLQVRCNVKLRRSENEGEILLDLNRKINCFISPWFPKTNGITKHFGWSLDKASLKSYIESLDYVERVGDDFTLMKIASADEQKFLVNLFENTDDKILRGTFPWSIAVPMRKHFINGMTPNTCSCEDNVNNGYGGLEIGQTFIIRKK